MPLFMIAVEVRLNAPSCQLISPLLVKVVLSILTPIANIPMLFIVTGGPLSRALRRIAKYEEVPNVSILPDPLNKQLRARVSVPLTIISGAAPEEFRVTVMGVVLLKIVNLPSTTTWSIVMVLFRIILSVERIVMTPSALVGATTA